MTILGRATLLPARLKHLEELIGTSPDPRGDQRALHELRDMSPPTDELVDRLRSEGKWNCLPIRRLLPGISLLGSSFFARRLGGRVVNPLARAGVSSWGALAELSIVDLESLSGVGREAVGQVLLGAISEWAGAYLFALSGGDIGDAKQPKARERLLRLVGTAPDPAIDRDLLLKLRDPNQADTKWLIRKLRTDETLQNEQLRKLFPGLGLIEAPKFSVGLSVRAANCLGRADAVNLMALARLTPAEIFALPKVGASVCEEILVGAAGEWATSYLTADQVESATDQPANSASGGTDSIVNASHVLSDAFIELEKMAGFEVFRRRRLDPDKPTQSTVATELRVSGSRVSQLERRIQSKVAVRLRDPAWPISEVVELLRDRLGSVALSSELTRTFTSVDPTGMVLSDDFPHRRILLLRLAGYRLADEWVLGPEIESLTRAVLADLADDGPIEVDLVRGSLSQLGVRAELQLAWIASQREFRVVDGKLTRHVE